MTTRHGFELIREKHIPELNTTAKLFRHLRTGAELLSLENDDENKAFSVNFKTPPADSTGIAHILEHSVLCGSRKYRVKEPFVELVKGSLNTFVNAVTFSDMTCYPVASQNIRDLYNLIDVYLDAVFHPLITEKTLQQEGWHYELENIEDPLIFKGVVFNEMKGAMASPDRMVSEYTQTALMPDTIYGFNAGGDPAAIPDLSYSQFKTFHEAYYHPSNARFYFYGNDDVDERLRYLDAFIAEFEKKPAAPAISLQPRFESPRRFAKPYDAGDESEDNKGYAVVSWLLSEVTDQELSLAFSILQNILIGTPGSPLRKALIDSGLGEDLAGDELSPYQRELFFATGLKGIDVANSDRIEALMVETLGALVKDGIETDMVEAAMNTIEFELRERNTGSFPRGLGVMFGMLEAWMHGADPLESLAFEPPLQKIKAHLAHGEKYFEGLIQKHFLNNSHRVTIVMEPDATYLERRSTTEKERLAQARAGMSEADLHRIVADTHELKLMQETPDSPEALAAIPTLTLADMEKKHKPLPIEILYDNGAKVLYHELFTNGIAYLDIGFNLHSLPQDYLPYTRLFGRALLEMGTQTEDYVRLSRRIGRKTGGIRPEVITSAVYNQSETAAWLMLRGKAMANRTQDLLDILENILTEVKLDNQERFRQMVLEEKTGVESALAPSGHLFAYNRMRSHVDEAGWLADQIGGIGYLFFLRELAQQVENDWGMVRERLEAMRHVLLNRHAMVVNVTVDEGNWAHFQSELTVFLSHLPEAPLSLQRWARPAPVTGEGLTIPAQVNYVAKGGNLYALGYQRHGSHMVITNYLRTTRLWEQVRVQGGAYGGFCGFIPTSGTFFYVSYRDPNLLNTLDVYDSTGDWLKALEVNNQERVKTIIGAVGDLDTYLLPDAKGYKSLSDHLTGLTDEMQQKIRDDVLATTAADFKAFGEVLAALAKVGTIAVLGSADAINSANATRGNFLKVTKVV